jgi:hypothetical protein
VSKNPDNLRPVLAYHAAGYLAILLAVMLFTCGCMQPQPVENTSPTPDPVETTTAEPAPVLTTATLPEITQHLTLPVKNITITRPGNLSIYTKRGFTDPVVKAVGGLSDPKAADIINRYLRWDSVRANTDKAEAARITGVVKNIDSAISTTPLKEDIVIYCGISSELGLLITNTSRYSDDGYVSGSYDPSVVYHTLSKSGRDREGYVTMLALREKPGAHLLFVNETTREILLPRAMIWDLNAEEKIGRLVVSLDSMPRYKDDQMDNVRLLYLTRIT